MTKFLPILVYNYLSAGIGFISTIFVIRLLNGDVYAIFVSLQYLSLLTFGIGQWGSNMLTPNWTKRRFFKSGGLLTKINIQISFIILMLTLLGQAVPHNIPTTNITYVVVIALFFVIAPFANQQKFIEAKYDLPIFYKIKFYYNVFWAVIRVFVAWFSESLLLLLIINLFITAYPILYMFFVQSDIVKYYKINDEKKYKFNDSISIRFFMSGFFGVVLFRIELVYFNLTNQLSDNFVITYLSYLPLVDLLYLTSTALAGFFWKKQYESFFIPIIALVIMLIFATLILTIAVPLYSFVTNVAPPALPVLILMIFTVISNFIGVMQAPYISKLSLQKFQLLRLSSGVVLFFVFSWLITASDVSVIVCGLIATVTANILCPLVMGYPNLLRFRLW